MKIKTILTILGVMIVSSFYAGVIIAQDEAKIAMLSFPIPELGNCANPDACKAYCDLPENVVACVDFGEKHNLIPKEEIKNARKFIESGSSGPGGCSGKEECEAYCDNMDNMDECIDYAIKNDLMPPHELEEARKVQAAIKRGVKPPPCGSKASCDVYCEKPENMEVCMNFAIEAGFMDEEEMANAEKMISALKRGVKPPPCQGKEACDAYCSEPANMEVCMTFAIEAGLMSPQEQAESKRMLEAIKKGVLPPKCGGREECDIYCSQEEHFEECTNFAVAAGFMSEEDAEMARRTGGKTPGDCRGEEECKAFCDNPNNQETCFNFAKEHGLISEEELQQMEQGRQEMMNTFNNMPAEVLECLQTKLGSDVVEKIKTGEMMPSRDLGDTMSECFRNMGPMGPPPGEGEFMHEGEFRPGPGGCTTPEECKRYCENNPDECGHMGPGPEDGMYMGPPPGEGEFMHEGEFRPGPDTGYMPHPDNYADCPEGQAKCPDGRCAPDFKYCGTMNYPTDDHMPPPEGTYLPLDQEQPLPGNDYMPPPEKEYPYPTDDQMPPPDNSYMPPPDDYPPPTDDYYQPPPTDTYYEPPKDDYEPPPPPPEDSYIPPPTDYQPPPDGSTM
jgi:hypothetical protein